MLTEIEALKAEAMDLRHEWAQGYEEWSALKAKNEALEETYRAALEAATLAEYMLDALDGEPSDFAQSFDPVRQIMDLKAERDYCRNLVMADQGAIIEAFRAEVARLEGLIIEHSNLNDKGVCARLDAEARAIRARKA